MHHSFAWCFFFYLSFLFPPVEPGVFNCCVTILTLRRDCLAEGFVVENIYLSILPTASISSEVSPAERK